MVVGSCLAASVMDAVCHCPAGADVAAGQAPLGSRLNELLDALAIFLEPGDGAAHAFFKRHLGAPAKKRLGSVYIQPTARLPVRLVGLPDQATLEAGHTHDHLRQVLD